MRQQLPPQIRKITYPSGKVVYQVCCDVTPVGGKRKQVRRNFDYEREARKFLADTLSDVAGGRYISKRGTTIKEVVQQWLSGQSGLRASSSNSDADRLKHFVTLYGDMPLQDLKKHHLDTLMDKLKDGDIIKANGKKCRPHNGLSRRNVLSAIKKVLNSEGATIQTWRLNDAQELDFIAVIANAPDPTRKNNMIRVIVRRTADGQFNYHSAMRHV